MCKERIKTRLFAILLVFCMLASSMPLLAYAAEGTEAEPAQQITEEKQEGTETQPSQEPAPNAEKAVTEIAEKAVSEAAEEPEAAQKADNTESSGKTAAPPLKAAANDATDPAEEDDGTGIETDEQTDLPEGGQEVKFVFDGADKLEAWIEGVSESSFSRDPETGDVIVDYDITINNNDTMTLNANSDIIFKGVEGKCLNIGVGNDLDNAKTIVTVSQPGKLATVGTTGECTVYVKVTDTPEDIGETIDGDPDDSNTTVSYSFITAEDDEGKYYGNGDPEVHSSIKKGDKFTGSAVCVSWKYNWGPGPSHADIKCTTGKLKGKVIGTACISGKSKALALKGAKFSYVAKVVKVDSKKGKVTYDVTFYPRDRHNVSYGELSNFHVATQTMAGTTTLSHAPQIDVSVKKVDTQPHYNHPENYNVGGAQFQIYTDEACTKKATDVKGNNALLTITADSTGHSGTSQTITLKKLDGTEFYVKEISCPKGYKLAGIGTVQEDMTVEEPNVTPQVKVVKKAAATDVDYLQFSNNYTLKGAEYTMYCDSACTKVAKDIAGKEVVFKTDVLGQTSPVRVDMGAYWVKETKAAKGFKKDPMTYSFTLTEAHEDEPYVVESTEEPAYKDPGLKVFKFDPTGAKGWKRLVNAEFTIKYYDVTVPYADENDIDPATVDLSSKTPARQWTFKTRKMPTNDPTVIMAGFDWNSDDPVSGDEFLTEGSSRILPCGFYTIEETESPTGLSLFEKIYHGKVYQPANGAAASIYTEDATADGQIITKVNVPNKPQHVTIGIKKQDAESQTSVAKGQASNERKSDFGSLAGAKYEVYFDNDETEKPEIVGTITTDEKGEAYLTKRMAGRPEAIGDDLEPGTYYVKEVKASPGYVIDKYILKDGKTEEVKSGKIEVICGYREDGQAVTKTITGDYGDGMHLFRTRAENESTEIFNYTVTSNDWSHETHIRKTDAATGKELPGAKLQIIDADDQVVEEWTSTTEEHIVWALPDGKYTLREITAPYGYDVAEDIEFEIKENVIANTVEMKNKPITVGTTALDDATHSHQGVFAEYSTIVDKVKVTGLYEGREYVIKGVMMDKATGEAFTDAEGNPVTAASEPFTATGDEMEVDVEFTVDSSRFTTDTVAVVFETLYRRSKVHDEETPVELQKHAEIGDEEQSIHYGGIVSTTALDKASKSHNILAARNVTIVDTVKFENLSPNSEYEIRGTIFDKTTGNLTDISATKKFTPKTADGTVDVEFTFDATELANHDLVVYETLLINNIEINKHEEPDDEDQTMYVPEIKTTATDVATGDHIAYGGETVRINDVVEYHNLIPGKQYTMNGTLMNQRTGKPVKVNGEAVTASKTFTPEKKDGTVQIEFVFNGIDLRGDTVVAFEECTVDRIPVAVHMDINDVPQSVKIPKIGTKAALVDKAVEDTVSYENLIPGQYFMRGWLVDKETGKKIEGSEGETLLNVTEGTTSGTVTVNLSIDNYDKLSGHKIVAFEECYYVVTNDDGTPGEKLVGEHKDIKDGKQTVRIPFGGPKTGDNTLIWLYVGLFTAAFSGMLFFVIREYAERRRQAKEDAEMFV
ncbi:MAG: VaFE repeat-containing surface-anchored protein [Mogibacterium sp.]|nr:VaFE repeat-containing surface-anchored protein [Mogibacterium sp.]